MDKSEKIGATNGAALVATFSINVTFVPRKIDPDAISQRLGLTPTWTWRAGERVRHPNGWVRPHPARESRWSLIADYYDRREDDLDPSSGTTDALGPRLNDRLAVFLEPFLNQRSFVCQVVADSSAASVTLSFPGQFHFGFIIDPTTLGKITELGLEFGFEIFPNSAT